MTGHFGGFGPGLRRPQQSGPLVDAMEDQHHAVRTRLLQVSKALKPWRDSASAGGASPGSVDATSPRFARG
jgi:hypothetical protein